MIDKLLEAAGIHRTEIDLMAFSCGPGSFTGVRLSASISQGIAMGLGVEVLPIPTSDAMANRVSKCFPELSEFFLRRQSHKGWAYLAQYSMKSGSCQCIEPDRLVEECHVPECAISNKDVFFGAEDVIEVAASRLDQSVPAHLALPKLVDGDSPYTPTAREQQATKS